MSELSIPVPEFGSRPEDLSSFNETINSINSHNQQFSLANLMANAMLDHIDQTERTQELIEAGATPEEAEQTIDFVGSEKVPLSEEEQMARSIVGLSNAPVLEATGLTLSPLRVTGTVFNGKGQESVGQVRLQIADGSKFSNFLLSVDPEHSDDKFQKNAEAVASNLIQEAKDAIAKNTDEETIVETLLYAPGIIAGLEHIGLSDSPITEKLRTLHDHAQRGDIKEYVAADDIGLLKDPTKTQFGPAQWQKDATGEFLTAHWDTVLEIIKAAKINPNASELSEQLIDSARDALKYAKADWSKTKTERAGSIDDYGQDFDKIFEKVTLELQFISSPDTE